MPPLTRTVMFIQGLCSRLRHKLQDDRAQPYTIRSEILYRWAAVATIVAFGFALRPTLLNQVSHIRRGVEDLQKQARGGEFAITYPPNNGEVEMKETIAGSGAYGDRLQYVIVADVKTGVSWVQDGPVGVAAGGQWRGTARFGTGAVGRGQKYLVECIATRSKLQAGEMAEMPKDAVFSKTVVVKRTR